MPVSLARTEPWYSVAPSAVANPSHVPSKHARNRFNDASGKLALRYFGPDIPTALLEATALHGSYATGFVHGPPPARSWTVFGYRILKNLTVVDFTALSERRARKTTVQELTGDWLGYHHRGLHRPAGHLPAVKAGAATAPTQVLGQSLHAMPNIHGFLAPSAKVPTIANLVLFFDRLPAGCLQLTGSATVVT